MSMKPNAEEDFVETGEFFLYKEVKIITKSGVAFEGTVNQITRTYWELEDDNYNQFIPRESIDAIMIPKEKNMADLENPPPNGTITKGFLDTDEEK